MSKSKKQNKEQEVVEKNNNQVVTDSQQVDGSEFVKEADPQEIIKQPVITKKPSQSKVILGYTVANDVKVEGNYETGKFSDTEKVVGQLLQVILILLIYGKF